MSASEQMPTPASFAIRPWGALTSAFSIRWVPSSRLNLKSSGLYLPAVGFSVPALSLGVFGICASLVGQLPPKGVAPVWKLLSSAVPSGLLQGVSVASVVLVLQVGGVMNEPVAPPKMWARMSSIGSSGFSVKGMVICPSAWV